MNPFYQKYLNFWNIMQDVYDGEMKVKERGIRYLPATSGMIDDGLSPGQMGYKSYEAYKQRAVFHDHLRDAVAHIVGLLHSKPPAITLPKSLEPLLTNINFQNQSIVDFMRFINSEQVVMGRVGIIVDLPVDSNNQLPGLRAYHAKSILDWDVNLNGDLNYVKLDESRSSRENGSWFFKTKIRELTLNSSGEYSIILTTKDSSGTVNNKQVINPVIRNKPLKSIPFVFVNTSDLSPEPSNPPLLGLANLSLAIYRAEADYRHNLFMQGQETLVLIDGPADEYIRIGSGVVLKLHAGGDAKYVGVSSAGLSEQRESLENDKAQARARAGELISVRTGQRESGAALQTRVAAQTASLAQIAMAGARGVEILCKIAADWVMADPNEVIISPNTDFVKETFMGRDLLDLITAKNMGAPLSQEALHKLMIDHGITVFPYGEERSLLESEEPLGSTFEDGVTP